MYASDTYQISKCGCQALQFSGKRSWAKYKLEYLKHQPRKYHFGKGRSPKTKLCVLYPQKSVRGEASADGHVKKLIVKYKGNQKCEVLQKVREESVSSGNGQLCLIPIRTEKWLLV